MSIEDRPPVGSGGPITQGVRSRARSGVQIRSTIIILAMLAAGYALTILVFQPGYATLDARYVYKDAQTWNFGDWQSPVMIVLWRLIDPLAPGTLSMFLFIATLYWLGFGLLALTVARRTPWLGLVTPLLALAAAGVLLCRDDLARRSVRRHLADRRRASIRGGGTRSAPSCGFARDDRCRCC